MINITNKIKQDKNRQYRKNHLNVIHHNNDLNRSCELNIYLSLYYHDQYINCWNLVSEIENYLSSIVITCAGR